MPIFFYQSNTSFRISAKSGKALALKTLEKLVCWMQCYNHKNTLHNAFSTIFADLDEADIYSFTTDLNFIFWRQFNGQKRSINEVERLNYFSEVEELIYLYLEKNNKSSLSLNLSWTLSFFKYRNTTLLVKRVGRKYSLGNNYFYRLKSMVCSHSVKMWTSSKPSTKKRST